MISRLITKCQLKKAGYVWNIRDDQELIWDIFYYIYRDDEEFISSTHSANK